MCIRRVVARRILQTFGVPRSKKREHVIASLLRMHPVSKQQSSLHNPYILHRAHFDIAVSLGGEEDESSASNYANTPEVTVEESSGIIAATLDPSHIAALVLSPTQQPQEDDTTYRVSKQRKLVVEPSGLHVAIEYSSPNIAKPFHMGHLRSTILGNVLGNLYEARGHRVTRVNWLGDWGTQFGLLILGFTRYGDRQLLNTDALRHLFEVYVRINGDVTREKGEGREDTSETYQEALSVFSLLERGDKTYTELWETFKTASLPQLDDLYQRLGVRFDEVGSESMYIDKSHGLLEQWARDGSVYVDEQTGVRCVDVDRNGERAKAPLLKSDGSTLYLMRDLAALLDRKERLKFDKIHYVVEKGQRDHFVTLTSAMHSLGHSWIHEMKDDFHVMFGRVEGMRTRTGEVVLLADLLDEGRRRMAGIMASKSTTRVEGGLDEVAECLSVSSVVVQEFTERRNRNYTFSWDKALSFSSDSGVFLQYTHARLCSLEENCGVRLRDYIDHHRLIEPEAHRVLLQIHRYDEVLRDALYTLEPHLLVKYLFQLAHLTNLAFKKLPVKGQATDIAEARLRMFCTSREILGGGLKLLGLTPLSKM